MTTKTLCTMVWGNYWERFGSRWVENYNNLNTKPDQILVVSDKPISVPSNFDVVIVPKKDIDEATYIINLFRQVMLDNSKCDWICTADLDDPFYPNYLDDIQDDYDIHNHVPEFKMDFEKHQDRRLWWGGRGQEYFNDYFNSEKWHHAPISPAAFFKKEFLIKYNVRITKKGWDDISLSWFAIINNAKVYWDSTKRYEYDVIDGGVSNVHTNPEIQQKVLEVQEMYSQFRKEYFSNGNYKALVETH